MTLKQCAMLGVAMALTGCLNTGEPRGGLSNYGFVTLQARLDPEQDYVLLPNAIFYRTGIVALPSTQGSQDICLAEEYVEPSGGVGSVPTLNAGAQIGIDISGNLTQITQGATARYVLGATPPPGFQPGDTATITIPGNAEGFPEWTLSAKTADPFTFDPIPYDDDELVFLPLTWTPPTTGGSRMVVSVRYIREDGVWHLFCELDDDGQHEVDIDVMPEWRVADHTLTEASFTRWRITAEAISGSILLAISQFEVPTPAADAIQ